MTSEDNIDSIDSMIKLGYFYSKLGDEKTSLKILEKAKRTIIGVLGDESEQYIDCVTDIARVHKKIGEYKAAFELQLEVVEKIRESKDKEKFAEALRELADTFLKEKKNNEAVYTAELSFNILR